MLRAVMKPCLTCQQLIEAKPNVIRCTDCETVYQSQRHKRQALTRDRSHYLGNYRSRAKVVRDTAEACWFCGEGRRIDDPFQADHLIPQDSSPDAILLPIHRSCNSKRAGQIKKLRNEKNKSSLGGAGGIFGGVA